MGTFAGCRKCISFILLYFLGLGVGNLKELKVRHINELLSNGITRLNLIKKTSRILFLSALAKQYIKNYGQCLDVLREFKTEDCFLLTTKTNLKKSINRSSLTHELNQCLKTISDNGKILGTHSFKTSFISRLLKSGVTVEKVSQLVGHKNVHTTAMYDPFILNQNEKLRLIEQGDRLIKE